VGYLLPCAAKQGRIIDGISIRQTRSMLMIFLGKLFFSFIFSSEIYDIFSKKVDSVENITNYPFFGSFKKSPDVFGEKTPGEDNQLELKSFKNF
jgi:hypothetical protein